MQKSIVLLAAAFALAASPHAASAQQQSVLTYHGDSSRTGNFIVPTLTPDKARTLHPDRNFDAHVDGHLYAQPLYWQSGSHAAMLVVATENDVVQAFDADTGKELWRRSVGRPVPASALPCGNIDPEGVTGTPVIDQGTGAIYFDAAVEDADGPHHRIFALSLKDGSVLPRWPVDVAAALRAQGGDFDPRTQNQRSALSILDGRVYVAFGGHFGDCGTYHGWIVGVSLDDPGKVVSFATKAPGGGIWAPGGLSIVGHSLFAATGNTFDEHNWGDGEAVLRLPPDLRRSDDKRDYFAPSNWRALNDRDEDLGGADPVPLDVPGSDGAQSLMLALGKDGRAYLLNRDDLGGIGGQLAAETVSRESIRTAAAVFPVGDAEFIAFQGPGAQCPTSSQGNGLTVLKVTGGSPPAMTTAWCSRLHGRGSAIVTTTDGRSNPIVWILGAEGDNRLHGYRAIAASRFWRANRSAACGTFRA